MAGFWSKVKGAAKTVGKGAVSSSKWAVQRTIVDPTKIAAKGALAVGKGTVAVGTNVAKGNVTGALKSVVKVGLAPAQTGVSMVKSAGTTVYQASKAVTNIALAPLRSRLNTLKDRRAPCFPTRRAGRRPRRWPRRRRRART